MIVGLHARYHYHGAAWLGPRSRRVCCSGGSDTFKDVLKRDMTSFRVSPNEWRPVTCAHDNGLLLFLTE